MVMPTPTQSRILSDMKRGKRTVRDNVNGNVRIDLPDRGSIVGLHINISKKKFDALIANGWVKELATYKNETIYAVRDDAHEIKGVSSTKFEDVELRVWNAIKQDIIGNGGVYSYDRIEKVLVETIPKEPKELFLIAYSKPNLVNRRRVGITLPTDVIYANLFEYWSVTLSKQAYDYADNQQIDPRLKEMFSTKKTVIYPNALRERNWKIYRRVVGGESRADIAREYKITRERVAQIVRRMALTDTGEGEE